MPKITRKRQMRIDRLANEFAKLGKSGGWWRRPRHMMFLENYWLEDGTTLRTLISDLRALAEQGRMDEKLVVRGRFKYYEFKFKGVLDLDELPF